MEGRFLLVIRDNGTDRELFKLRFSFKDTGGTKKTSLEHDSSTAKPSSSKILIGLTAIFGYRLLSTDVCQAY